MRKEKKEEEKRRSSRHIFCSLIRPDTAAHWSEKMRKKKKERERKRDGQHWKFLHSFLGKCWKKKGKEEGRKDGKGWESFARVGYLVFAAIAPAGSRSLLPGQLTNTNGWSARQKSAVSFQQNVSRLWNIPWPGFFLVFGKDSGYNGKIRGKREE